MNEKSTINNEYDYSNIIPTEDYVLYLVKYCDGIYNQMIRLMNEDEEKNNYDCGLRDVLCWIIWRLWTVRDEAG